MLTTSRWKTAPGGRFLIANDGMFPVAVILEEQVAGEVVSWLTEVSMAARTEKLERKNREREDDDDDI